MINETVKSLKENLSKSQKIGLLVIAQIIIIVLLASIVQIALKPKEHIEIAENDGVNISEQIPEKNIEQFEDELWNVIKDNADNVDKSVLNDAVIREGSLEIKDTDIGKSASFLVDIDSIKQTFRVDLGWVTEKNSDSYDDVVINCSRKDEMKYPETVCHGMYNDSYSLDLYLPQDLIAVENGQEHYYGAVYEGENTNEIDAVLLVCDLDKARKLADDYLGTIPLDLSSYKINYEIMKDVDCLDDFDEEDDDDE